MKNKILLAVGIIAATSVLVGCSTTVGPAKTTLDPMKNVGHLTSVKRTTEVTSGTTNISMVETIESPEVAQLELRLKELEAKEKVGVAKEKAKAARTGFWGWMSTPAPYYSGGYYSSGYSGGYYGGSYYGGGITTSYGEGGRNVIYSTPGGSPGTGGQDGGGNYVYGRRH